MKKLLQIKPLFAFACLSLLVSFPAHANLQKVNSFLANIEDILRGASIASVTIAIMIVGYQITFGGKTFRDCAPVLIGGLLIGGAAEFARFLMA